MGLIDSSLAHLAPGMQLPALEVWLPARAIFHCSCEASQQTDSQHLLGRGDEGAQALGLAVGACSVLTDLTLNLVHNIIGLGLGSAEGSSSLSSHAWNM